MTLALLWLTSFQDPVGVRSWKGQDWDTMERLHAKGLISDPKSKAKAVVLIFRCNLSLAQTSSLKNSRRCCRKKVIDGADQLDITQHAAAWWLAPVRNERLECSGLSNRTD
jgi:hypothetical protein